MKLVGVVCILCFFVNNFKLAISLFNKDRFYEELLIKPLHGGHVYSYFQFTTVWDVEFKSESFRHCHLFPRALGEVVAKHNVRELHISLTQGSWRHEKWGYQVIDAPPGAELLVWFKEGTEDVDGQWKHLTGALSGLLCASLNFIGGPNSLSPEHSFPPTGVLEEAYVDGKPNSSYVRYATLPREVVCTENLTPWKKLLPCDTKKGLSTLLNAGHIYNTNYLSLGIHLRPICRDESCLISSVELVQTVSLVYDTAIVGTGSRDWSIRSLFGSGLAGPCPLASSSMIYIDISQNMSSFSFRLNPPPQEVITSLRGGQHGEFAAYDVTKLSLPHMFNVAAQYLPSSGSPYGINIPPPIFHASRYIVGYGQERGGIVTRVHNNYRQPLDVIYFENIPWFLPVYMHTLQITSNGEKIEPVMKHYKPGMERTRPYHLEVGLRLPPRSVTEISLRFDYIFLKWQEYPPDANHGFYVGSAVFTTYLPIARNYTSPPQEGSLFSSSFNASKSGYPVQLRTEVLLVSLPTPDFSMPYNVICLACTVVALAFGPLHNITTKRLMLTNIQKKGVLDWLKSKLWWKSKEKSE
ncbi:GPI transamidase component PIG-T [Ischnura elegans]|uniref:GPI transamidase component PIG-T n=1 Tax=Ischnura elegans TaxID=197161 RepID=UPI001ED89CCA|nr:GPI transamidase component PIG-T [Ischnura elegans]